MIRITKPGLLPTVLATTGKKKRRAMCVAFTHARQDYLSGAKKFDFDSNIYRHHTVKEVLIDAQHGKCAFCESKITHISYGDVEHFRPRGGYCQDSRSNPKPPGYYWLAYEWTNLFLACELCNRRHKRNLFPLRDPSKRATSHKHNPDLEEPLFIDPAKDDPETYISFRMEVPYAIRGNRRGRATIKSLGLERETLGEIRRDRYKVLKVMYAVAKLDPPIPESADAQAYLNDAMENAAEFANMARAAIATQFH